MKVDFKGQELTFNLVRGNLRKEVASYFTGLSEEDIPDSLVKYNAETNTVTVDEHVDESYAKYAAIHEVICCGPYKDLAPDSDVPNERCGLIDKMLIQAMPQSEREAYINRRIEMFKTLIERKLNPSMKPIFLESLKTLESLRDKGEKERIGKGVLVENISRSLVRIIFDVNEYHVPAEVLNDPTYFDRLGYSANINLEFAWAGIIDINVNALMMNTKSINNLIRRVVGTLK